MVCACCKQDPRTADGCVVSLRERSLRERVPYPAESTARCHDCHVLPGRLHHPGCDAELCPVCNGQSIGCDCADTALMGSAILARIRDEVRPRLDHPHAEGGYDCCGCA